MVLFSEYANGNVMSFLGEPSFDGLLNLINKILIVVENVLYAMLTQYIISHNNTIRLRHKHKHRRLLPKGLDLAFKLNIEIDKRDKYDYSYRPWNHS